MIITRREKMGGWGGSNKLGGGKKKVAALLSRAIWGFTGGTTPHTLPVISRHA